MIHTYVSSSNIQRLGWKNKTLFIQFNSGEVYSYDSVDFVTYQALAEADSVGQHFHRFVRSRFNYTKLDHNPFEPKQALIVSMSHGFKELSISNMHQ